MLSIIIPIYIFDDDLLEITLRCLRTLRETTKGKYELIIVDNASIVEPNWNCDIYIRNKVNKGNAVAWNQGLAVANGDYLLLSDNDVEFTEGWEKLKEHTKNSIVFPKAWLSDRDKPEAMLTGFFWMMDRETYNKLGPVSEEYGLAYFEDTDYFRKAQSKHLKLKSIDSVYVKHVGRATADKVLKDDLLFKKNKDIYETKWKTYPYINQYAV